MKKGLFYSIKHIAKLFFFLVLLSLMFVWKFIKKLVFIGCGWRFTTFYSLEYVSQFQFPQFCIIITVNWKKIKSFFKLPNKFLECRLLPYNLIANKVSLLVLVKLNTIKCLQFDIYKVYKESWMSNNNLHTQQ